jgi:hypothetical protein
MGEKAPRLKMAVIIRPTTLIVLAGLFLVVSAIGPLNTAFGPCHNLVAKATDGTVRTVNLDPLWEASKATPFQAMDPAGQWMYEFAICANTVQCGGKDAAACQETNQVPPTAFPLGEYPASISATLLKDTPMGSVEIRTKALGDPSRGAIVTIHCDPKATTPTNFSVQSAPVGSQPPFIYRFFLTHQSACGWLKPVEGPCHKLEAHGPNGEVRTVNLDELSTLSALAPFQADDSNTGLHYDFGVCQNIPCTANNIPSAGCVTTPAPFAFSLGPFPPQVKANLTTEGYIYGAIQLVIPQYQYQHMLLTIICDYNAKYPSNPFVISPRDGSSPPWLYQLFITHRSACGV